MTEDRENLKKNTGFETFDDMQTYATWLVIQGIARGDKLASTMHSVFNLHYRWATGIAKMRKGK